MNPREYQIECVEALFAYFETKFGNPVCAYPTATGKSVMIGLFLKQVFELYPRQKIIVVTHVKELIAQNYSRLLSIWPAAPAGIYSAGLNRKEIRQITFAGIASIHKLAGEFGHVDLIIIDEAHLVSNKSEAMYLKFIMALKTINPYLKAIGFSATPWRTGQGALTDEGEIFTDLAIDKTRLDDFNWFLEKGYLAPLVPKRTALELDISEVGILAGEFNSKQLEQAVDKATITRAAIDEAVILSQGRSHILIFSSGITHSQHIQEYLHSKDVTCTIVHSKLPAGERDSNIAAFCKGEYRCMVNFGVLTTGFDFPGIDSIWMLRPTNSSVLWVQMLGRGMRPVYAKGYDLSIDSERLQAMQAGLKQDCLVLDFARNTARLGPVNDPLVPNRKKKGAGGGQAPFKICEVCNVYNHASARFCSYCQTEFLFKVRMEQEASTDELIKRSNDPPEVPIIDILEVTHVTYAIHKKAERPDSLKATYYCGLTSYSEYICIEHGGKATKRAIAWWNERTSFPVPNTTLDALQHCWKLLTPLYLKIWLNAQYPEIVGQDLIGDKFGTAMITDQRPLIQVYGSTNSKTSLKEFDEEDIPF